MSPEELVMRNILSSEDPCISLSFTRYDEFLNLQDAASEFVIGWRKNFLEVELRINYNLDNASKVYEERVECRREIYK